MPALADAIQIRYLCNLNSRKSEICRHNLASPLTCDEQMRDLSMRFRDLYLGWQISEHHQISLNAFQRSLFGLGDL